VRAGHGVARFSIALYPGSTISKKSSRSLRLQYSNVPTIGLSWVGMSHRPPTPGRLFLASQQFSLALFYRTERETIFGDQLRWPIQVRSAAAAAMIVCSCNVLTDQDVRSMLSGADGLRTVGEIYSGLNCSVLCGRCAPTIRRIIDETLAKDNFPRAL
jgi:bacterioferritin-associated ferredoxin